ncbi:ParB/RepB/Spo0J family partition protein [Rubricella aquisinus]|uniref:ParB/RepB/Spo0J family partition protein n=1 Tax=Rubricella aquisinus TaxID=2028108 RepID=A0A840WY15_9RHOB|nr:ParB N-terminal domain-containing protein [Rubricella aquisinus]MBB5514566.1 ParB/RepB/Spo0J family partition protein [Rubricella aquisinus]
MAKRKRLTPPDPAQVQPAPETKAGFPSYPLGLAPSAAKRPAPIADVAGAAAATAALQEVTAELTAAQTEGRLIRALPLAAIVSDHLVRDRIAVDSDEMETLIASIKARGQQTPIEVVQLAAGQYGLISGWRRLSALSTLQAREGGFDTVLALIRSPQQASDAYVAMVEENEIRVGLSYFERARIVARAVEEGVYPTTKAALQDLFASASRTKRSKIKSFLTVVEELGPVLTFPTALGERMGLDLSSRLEEPGFAARLREALGKETPDTPEDEASILTRALKANVSRAKQMDRPAPDEVAPGIYVKPVKDGVQITGPNLTEAHIAHIRAILEHS